MDMPSFSEEQREKIACVLAPNRVVADAIHGQAHPKDTPYMRYGKRAIDIIVSAAALVATAPINAVLAIVTFFDVGQPIIFKQERAGKDGVPFTIIKFRNMTNETDAQGNLLPPELRVTKWGHFVRSSSLDELLNFWSIFKGDMSIIGPRPLLVEYTNRYCDYHKARLAVKPGLECPTASGQVDVSTWEGQLWSDVWYAEHISLITDVKKFFRLVEAVFDKRSTKVRGSAGRTFFMGYDEEGIALGLGDVSPEFIEKAMECDE